MRIAAGIEYNGSNYHGWQTQSCPPQNTLQAQCEKALSQVADHPIYITCAGRTDKGVHALSQVIHFDTTANRTMHAWISGANHCLPHDIRLLWAKAIDISFHARYCATARRYQYILYNHPIRPALLDQRVSWYPKPLDVKKMIAGAQFLVGEHDFSAFRAADCQAKTTLRNVTYLEFTQHEHFIDVAIEANAFLHHMVRNIVGVLLAIGYGEREPIWAQEVLLSGQRSEGGITASPEGLYLTQVSYPDRWQIPSSHNLNSMIRK